MREVVIRAAEAADYEEVHEVYACPGVVRGTLQLPYVSMDVIRKRLEEPSSDTYTLVADVYGRVVGDLKLLRRKGRLAHVADLGMAVHDDYQGQSIGTALMEAAIDMADNWLNLKRVELDVYTDNARAIHLYKNFGFEIEDTRRALSFREGEYVDAYAMSRMRM